MADNNKDQLALEKARASQAAFIERNRRRNGGPVEYLLES